MTKELSKAIMTRLRLRNIYNHNKTAENWELFKRRNLCVTLRPKSIRNYFARTSQRESVKSTTFWKTIRPFLNNKDGLNNEPLSLFENGELVIKNDRIAEIFYEYYINILKEITGNEPSSLPSSIESDNDLLDIYHIIEKFKDHPSVTSIKESVDENVKSEFIPATEADIFDRLLSVNAQKPGGYDKIPPKLVSLSADVLAKPFMHVVNSGIHSHTFADSAKVAVVTLVFKKDNRHNKQNFRPISVLKTFSKVFERYLLDQLSTYFEPILSQFFSAYRKHFNTHVLLRLIEEWRLGLDNNKAVGAVLMDLSKAFDCLSHDLITAKLAAYGLGDGALQIVYSYLKNRKQSVKVKGVISLLKVILAGVLQGSLLGPLLFNIFISDMFCFITLNLHNFANDNTLSAAAESLQSLANELEHQAKKAIDWIQMNQMIANPEKFKAIVLKRLNVTEALNVNLEINDIRITTSSEVDLLGEIIDSKLTFDSYIRNICKRSFTPA